MIIKQTTPTLIGHSTNKTLMSPENEVRPAVVSIVIFFSIILLSIPVKRPLLPPSVKGTAQLAGSLCKASSGETWLQSLQVEPYKKGYFLHSENSFHTVSFKRTVINCVRKSGAYILINKFEI